MSFAPADKWNQRPLAVYFFCVSLYHTTDAYHQDKRQRRFRGDAHFRQALGGACPERRVTT